MGFAVHWLTGTHQPQLENIGKQHKAPMKTTRKKELETKTSEKP